MTKAESKEPWLEIFLVPELVKQKEPIWDNKKVE